MERACFTESTKGGLLIARFNQQFRLVSAFRGKRLPLCGLHPRNQKKVSHNTKQNKNVAADRVHLLFGPSCSKCFFAVLCLEV